MAQKNVNVVRGAYGAFERGDLQAVSRFHDPEIEWPTSSEDPDAAPHRGRAAVRRYMEGYMETFPDCADTSGSLGERALCIGFRDGYPEADARRPSSLLRFSHLIARTSREERDRRDQMATERETERRVVEGALTIEVGPEVETCLVHVSGELDIATAPALENELGRLLSSDLQSVILDLDELLFIDSTGLRCLLQVTRRSRADGDRLRMRGANPDVDRILRFTGIREVLPFIE
jgi:anti-anti-sigma factor